MYADFIACQSLRDWEDIDTSENTGHEYFLYLKKSVFTAYLIMQETWYYGIVHFYNIVWQTWLTSLKK